MFWYSAIVLLLLALAAWRHGKQLKADKDSAGLGNALYAAAAFGAVGALCFFVAALL